MISELYLENFLFIKKSQLEFCPGLNVITGETGAGKSILLEAVKLLLGKKGKPGLVLPGTSSSKIQARLSVSESPFAREYLAQLGLNNEDNPNELIISRTFRAEGTEKIWINGILSTTAVLKNLGVFLMEIHGQNEHQTLLEPKIQRTLLDRTGGESQRKRLESLKAIFDSRNALLKELQDWENRMKEKESRLEELYEIRHALDILNLESVDEEEKLKEEENRLQHSEQITSAIERCLISFGGEENTPGITSLLFQSRENLRKILTFEPRFKNLFERLDSMYQEANDLKSEIERGFPLQNFDPEKLNSVQSRLADISRACRRYRTDCRGLFDLRKAVEKEIDELSSPNSTWEKKKKELAEIEKEFCRIVQEISHERKKLASKLEKKVTAELKQLGFAFSDFSIALNPIEYGPNGGESVEFLVSLNPGSPGGPLRKIASGGELSRVALAIKKVLAKNDLIPSLVFDEIDSGIGGETAEAVAKSLKNLGREKQILLVTHLHQIAKEADRHFTVEKKTDGKSTIVEIGEVSGENREREIARMLGTKASEGLNFAKAILKSQKSAS